MSAFPLTCNIAHTKRFAQSRTLRSQSEPNGTELSIRTPEPDGKLSSRTSPCSPEPKTDFDFNDRSANKPMGEFPKESKPSGQSSNKPNRFQFHQTVANLVQPVISSKEIAESGKFGTAAWIFMQRTNGPTPGLQSLAKQFSSQRPHSLDEVEREVVNEEQNHLRDSGLGSSAIDLKELIEFIGAPLNGSLGMGGAKSNSMKDVMKFHTDGILEALQELAATATSAQQNSSS